jgi:predicted enzyme related to lactoylglutathione lyase
MLNIKSDGQLHRFRWVDLASADAGAAQSFYRDLFGWTVRERSIGEGRFSTFEQADGPFASLYQLTCKQIGQGVPSHWTAYVSVADVDAAAAKAASLGGEVIVPPHDVIGFARISLISDPAGALLDYGGMPLDSSGSDHHLDGRSLPPDGLIPCSTSPSFS